jgi:hypothetical protein
LRDLQVPLLFGDLTSDPRLLWGIAIVAVVMLLGTWLLARRRRGKLNRAAILCGIVSIALHVLLIILLPYASRTGGGPPARREDQSGFTVNVNVSAMTAAELVDSTGKHSVDDAAREPVIPPLPIAAAKSPVDVSQINENETPREPAESSAMDLAVPNTMDPQNATADRLMSESIDSLLDAMMADAMPPENIAMQTVPEPEIPELDAENSDTAIPNTAEPNTAEKIAEAAAAEKAANQNPSDGAAGTAEPNTVETTQIAASPAVPQSSATQATPASMRRDQTAAGTPGRVLGPEFDDFANRQGSGRQQALLATGGDLRTEAAVAAGIEWLSRFQRADGAWDPATSGAGIERSVLGQHRSGAGSRATTGITGLALLSMLGAGNTHQQGQHQQSVRAGLQYLLTIQSPDGSLIADADPYARTYCHGMAALAMSETAAMTRDAVALDSARAAVGFTTRTQHPTTGGWRYVAGDPGDTSQLGWQAMVLVSGRAAGLDVPEQSFERTRRFLQTVRAGRTGGLASYKPGEAPSRTMTAEALATRLLLGERVPRDEIAEAENYILQAPPGVGTDNYYYWYYASLALHQLQNPAWVDWNEKMKTRLLETQQSDGSWSTATVWGGHGGKVYTTAMACLCLEVYYRHQVR